MSDSPGRDESTPVHDGVVLVIEFRRFAGAAGAPAGIGVHRAERQTTLGVLAVFRFLPFHPTLVHAGVIQKEQTLLLNGPFPELLHGQPATGQLAAVDLGLDQAGIGVHLRRQQAQPEQFVIQAMKDGLAANPFDEVADGGMIEHHIVDGEETEPAVR